MFYDIKIIWKAELLTCLKVFIDYYYFIDYFIVYS